jgi:hypothetical protein
MNMEIDHYALARVNASEAGSLPFIGQVAVAWVVRNNAAKSGRPIWRTIVKATVKVDGDRVPGLGDGFFGRQGDPEARRDVDVFAVDHTRLRERAQHGLRHGRDLVAVARRAHHERERIAAHAGHGGRSHADPAAPGARALAQAAAQPFGDLHQDLAAAEPSVRAVDELEAVQIQEEQRLGRAGAMPDRERALQGVFEGAPLREALRARAR